ncbi:poly(hydroxyalkanoate) depolymerase family esterase [Phyllobacterium sp. 1468]|uniref:extracellular catalytic domain type 1 short-chain-length polyhydroxyalkanoate depolymerase n=1 Tax=Phyllobacterium sp. 1468 TaxID=2817759 RepID=UPI001AE30A8C|nr:PHB depolymerase family esterase [Phyllobacterium sp. 1468]MDR6636164.1 poly(hydroxyalkanoate) depolymerase family esterase [Phyllobacterium sp. 1468]
MRNIADMINRLNGQRSVAKPTRRKSNTRLCILPDFGSNPGDLLAWMYIPKTVQPGSALVVVLHGCTQTAADYCDGSGWSELADQYGFALLFAEQQRKNNPNLCFNWFATEDTTRGQGEVCSISQMIEVLRDRLSIDPAKICVTGLSAGGAMAAAMLATYPEMFKGGAIIAGLPYGSASSIPEAFDRMRGHGLQDSRVLADRVRRASDHQGAWPTISVWHGTADRTVDPVNMEAILGQWRSLHEIDKAPMKGTVDGHPVRKWSDTEGTTLVEAYTINGMGHGTPLQQEGVHSYGSPRAFMLDVGISSTWHIAKSWGLLGNARTSIVKQEANAAPQPERQVQRRANRSVSDVIEDALRTAGLLK